MKNKNQRVKEKKNRIGWEKEFKQLTKSEISDDAEVDFRNIVNDFDESQWIWNEPEKSKKRKLRFHVR